jgi:exosortase
VPTWRWLGMYVAAFAWDIRFVSAVSLIVVLAGLLWLFYGFKAVQAMAFPLGFLLFMIPFPYYNDVGFRLQKVSIHSCTWILHALGLPITTVGSEISLGDTSFSIGLPCSGLNTLAALLALGAVFVYLLDGPAYKRVILLAVSFPLALLANALRIVSIILIGYYYNLEFATGFYHDISSLVFFVLAFLCLLLASRVAGCRLRIRRGRGRAM